MAAEVPNEEQQLRNRIALRILAASAVAITLLASVAVFVDPKNALTVFNITLPVLASWVGTVLAFYFGRENFESANDKVRQLIDKLSPEERASAPVSSIMRKLADTTHVALTAAKGADLWTLKELRALLTDEISRLPVVDADGLPKYVIHGSSLSRHLADGGKGDDSLETFLGKGGDKGVFGAGRGFALTRPSDSIAVAKTRMEAVSSCQDIFVTADGTEQQPLLGWVSNVRLGKFLRA